MQKGMPKDHGFWREKHRVHFGAGDSAPSFRHYSQRDQILKLLLGMRRKVARATGRCASAAALRLGGYIAWRVGYEPNRHRPNRKECAMKLTSAQVERTLTQFKGEVIPDNHPVVPQLEQLVRRAHVLPRRSRTQHRRAVRDE